MLKQVIRAGDQVVFARAHEHPQGDTRSFLVEEVIPPGSSSAPASTVPHARIVPVTRDLLRRLVGIADQHKPLAKIGVITETINAETQWPDCMFTPSEEQ